MRAPGLSRLRTSRLRTLLVLVAAFLAPASAATATPTTWEPGTVGILGQFGTLAEIDRMGANCCPFAPINGEDQGFAIEPAGEDPAVAAARATATPGEFSVEARADNLRDVGGQPLSAAAAAAADFYIPALGSGAAVLWHLLLDGSFESDSNGSFLIIDVRVDDRFPVTVSIVHDDRGSFTELTRTFADGSFTSEDLGPWPGSMDFGFFVSADPDEDTFGTLDLRLWVQTQSKGDASSAGNFVDFFGTATLTAEPPPGGFVGLATGMAFVPEPPLSPLLVAAIAGLWRLGAVRGRTSKHGPGASR